uniref:Uncharacterized protein n=1 Tax=Chromera velia CCMP2878 TaxID=1169474 RepID=A0A0G4EYZ5_9ALVE|eukprot:Cvel_14258.t1-p1 / transcript=Cvel_14258.t1 / gene=Cvel_14258 / organism=Chromera_velia_CCMP2878 / gene_product=hypothetical protein / transcript_product=hypothetical protein / location=Cvel_scaffold1006:56853-57413(-) / protein_length=187 / sequence_SO=supercontig / SO=protein_coding / is_pseudo=false
MVRVIFWGMDVKGIGMESREICCFHIGYNDFTGVKIGMGKCHGKGNMYSRLGDGSARRGDSFMAVEERSAVSNDSRLVSPSTFLNTLLGVNKMRGHCRAAVLGVYFGDWDSLVRIVIGKELQLGGTGLGSPIELFYYESPAGEGNMSCRSLERTRPHLIILVPQVHNRGTCNGSWVGGRREDGSRSC